MYPAREAAQRREAGSGAPVATTRRLPNGRDGVKFGAGVTRMLFALLMGMAVDPLDAAGTGETPNTESPST